MGQAEHFQADHLDEDAFEAAREHFEFAHGIAEELGISPEGGLLIAQQMQFTRLSGHAGGFARFAQAIDELIPLIEKRGDSAVDAGEGNAAEIRLGPLIRGVDVVADTNGNATLKVEVSNDGFEWTEIDDQSVNDATSRFSYDVPWRWIRAWADQNVDKIEVSAGGFQ